MEVEVAVKEDARVEAQEEAREAQKDGPEEAGESQKAQ